MAEERVDRRLAAIFAGDIAGYSRLIGVDEEGTLRQLKAHRTKRSSIFVRDEFDTVFHRASKAARGGCEIVERPSRVFRGLGRVYSEIRHVRFAPESRHRSARWQCLLCATFGHTRSLIVRLDYVEPTHINRVAPMSPDACFPNL